MIELLGKQNGEVILLRIEGKKVLFGSTKFGTVLSEIDGLQLDYEGVIKEHPDLKDKENWREEVIIRFKEKLNSFSNEEQRCEYLIEDLKPHGFNFHLKKIKGFRPMRL